MAARRLVAALPMEGSPVIRINPSWWPRLPVLPFPNPGEERLIDITPFGNNEYFPSNDLISMRVMAIDPGEKNIGLSISDPTGTIANPLLVLHHISRPVDAAAIAQIASDNQVDHIIVGQALDADNRPTRQSRRAARLAQAIRSQTSLPVELWDESGSTSAARSALLEMHVSRHKRTGHHDDLAATYILQTFLDTKTADLLLRFRYSIQCGYNEVSYLTYRLMSDRLPDADLPDRYPGRRAGAWSRTARRAIIRRARSISLHQFNGSIYLSSY